MFLRLVYQSFHRQRRSKLLAGIAVALGVAVATAMVAVATDIGDKLNRELRAFGANIIVRPVEDTLTVRVGGMNVNAAGAAYLNEADLPKIKGIFWRHNILGFAPFLPVQTRVTHGGFSVPAELLGTYFSQSFRYGNETFTTGVRKTHPWWKVQGTWPKDESDSVLVGAALAGNLQIHVGDSVSIAGREFPVSGILETGGPEDSKIVAPLHIAQALAGRPGAVKSIYVSALTKPEDAFARRDPYSLSPADRDRWYCSPYANSIAFQLTEAIPHSQAEQIRQVAQREGQILSRVQGLMLLITLAALVAAALAVYAAMATALMERRREIGLMKALGASSGSVAGVFHTEAALLALLGGSVGFVLGGFMARQVGQAIFGIAITVHAALLPIVLLAAGAIVLAGSALAIRRAAQVDPVLALRGDA